MQLKKEMMSPQNRKLAQPPDGLSFLIYILEMHDLYLITLVSCLFSFHCCDCGLGDAFSMEMLWIGLLRIRK